MYKGQFNLRVANSEIRWPVALLCFHAQKLAQKVSLKYSSVEWTKDTIAIEEATTKEEKQDEHNVQDVEVLNKNPLHIN